MPKRNGRKKERSNHDLSLTVANSISDIIKFSFDDEFRKRSFNTLEVNSTKDVESEIYTKLMAFAENPKSFDCQTVTADIGNEIQSIQKSSQMDLSQSLFQSEEECEDFSECSPDLSQSIFSQTCSQISQEQEERRLRQKSIILSANSDIITPQIYESLFSHPL